MRRQGRGRSRVVAAAVVVVGAALGGCGNVGLEELNPTGWFPTPSRGVRPTDSGFTASRGAAPSELPATTSSDLVGADGQCLGGISESEGPPRGITLTMTECELVAAAGVPEQVNIGASENGERRTVLTYSKGDNAGVYTFEAGRLKIIERLPDSTKPDRRRQPSRQRT